MQVFSGTRNAHIISLNNTLFLDWLFDYSHLISGTTKVAIVAYVPRRALLVSILAPETSMPKFKVVGQTVQTGDPQIFSAFVHRNGLPTHRQTHTERTDGHCQF